jgi:DDE superfamily endonuclease
MIVLKAATLLERWVVDELAPDTMLAYSDSGYSNDEINLE